MSKFLKFIVHFAIICTILSVLALVAPPFAGISTTVIDNPNTKTNLAFGSVTYAKEVDSGRIAVGDSVIIKDSQGVYLYRITEIDTGENIYKVKNIEDSKAEEKSIALKDSIPKKLLTVPALGFFLVAVQRVEGLIILALAVIFLIILYILAELWKKEPKKNEEEESNLEEKSVVADPNHIKTKKEIKMEEKERIRQLKEEEKRIRAEEKARRKARKQLIRSGGFVDDIEEEPAVFQEEESVVQETPGEETPVVEQAPEEEAAAPKVTQNTIVMPPISEKEEKEKEAEETAKEGLEEPTFEEPAMEESTPAEDIVPQALELQESEEMKKPAADPPKEIKKIAIPLYTAEQLLKKSQEEGEEPEIIQDEMTGVTLFDYSEIITGDGGEDI